MRLIGIISLLLSFGALSAVELLIDPPRVQRPEVGGSLVPGRAVPVEPGFAVAMQISWDTYVTLIGVEEGRGMRRRAWVATLDKDSRDMVVAYTGTAFRDRVGDLHIDCQGALITGPQADSWSPDSFAISNDGRVRIIDDFDRGNPGRAITQIRPKKGDPRYHRLLALARAWVLGRI